MQLFDYINIFFSDNISYDNLSNSDKIKNTFMLNRLFSIKYPMQAALFNKNGTSALGINEAWHLIGSKHHRTPGWIWTKKEGKKTDNSVEKKIDINKDILSEFCRIYELDSSALDDLRKYKKDEFIEQYKAFEKYVLDDVSKRKKKRD